MNGDEKEEAHRPRPLSGGIWTLFSWLRRSERSSSSDSLSSVGSARTAASFDFLSPRHCDLTDTHVVLNTSLSPPTETYKKRLQDRNLRRQIDRDITLHRKYGLFREHGYDGFSLPSPARRIPGNTVFRQNRERRATSECLQRRAAYVPGKRRAPLPPTLVTSASLPRSYKRKRPAPKPPVKNTVEKNINQTVAQPARMNSNLRSNDSIASDKRSLKSNNIEKCDKKGSNEKDIKSKVDRSFLKHIFENKKRNSPLDTTSVRLLPSISELDKQAAEIIENNRSLKNKNKMILENDTSNVQNSTTSREEYGWFCTSCLRKYDSSVNSCNYCSRENRPISNVETYSMKNASLASTTTQTTNNLETASCSRKSIDERKILKEILKEMKDSLRKKRDNKDIIVNSLATETPTLRIGSTVQETYKGLTPQSSVSSDISSNDEAKKSEKNTAGDRKALSTATHLSETQNNRREQSDINLVISSIIEHKGNVAFENHKKKCDVQSTSQSTSVHYKASLPIDHRQKESVKNVELSTNFVRDSNLYIMNVLLDKTKSENIALNKTRLNKVMNDKNTETVEHTNVTYLNNSEIISDIQSVSTKTNDNKEPIVKLLAPNETALNVNQQEHLVRNQKITTFNETRCLPTSPKKHEPTLSDKIQQMPSKSHFQKYSEANNIVVNSVTVVTSNNEVRQELKELRTKHFQNDEIKSSRSEKSNGKSTNANFKSTFHLQPRLQTDTKPISNCTAIANVKPEFSLHTPLRISSLLNPLYSPRLSVIKEKNKEVDFNKQLQSDLKNNSADTAIADDKAIHFDKTESKQVEKVTCPSVSTASSQLITTKSSNVLMLPIKPNNKDEISVLNERIPLPSSSECSSRVTSNADNYIDKLDQYDQRRHLIRQLEQSIAKGDELAAAAAAARLAKLKLSCSVLSFSSQIIAEPCNQAKNVSEKILLNEVSNKQSDIKKLPDQNSIQAPSVAEKVKSKETQKNEIPETLENNVDPEKNSTKLKNPSASNIKPELPVSEPSTSTKVTPDDIVPITVWVEDKQAARGPIRLRISRKSTIEDLRRQAEHSLGLATHLQRWIVGRTLCTDNTTMVVSLAGPDLKAPFYLCLVQSEEREKTENRNMNIEKNGNDDDQVNQNNEFYTELMKLELQSLIPNVEPFECGVCMEECAAGAGVVLRECIHTFCRECLSDVVQHCQEPVVCCPAVGCSGILQEREIRKIVTPEEYERWLARSLTTAECGTRNTFHCRTRDCTGWAFCDPGVRRFPCPVCMHTNCVQCQAIHENETCEEHQTKLRAAVTAAEIYKDDEGTQALLNSLIARGEALECPQCKAIITKKWGCDWVKCSACKTEICWVTKGRRWGPGGRGDTSGGCRCGVEGQRCHPACGYCH